MLLRLEILQFISRTGAWRRVLNAQLGVNLVPAGHRQISGLRRSLIRPRGHAITPKADGRGFIQGRYHLPLAVCAGQPQSLEERYCPPAAEERAGQGGLRCRVYRSSGGIDAAIARSCPLQPHPVPMTSCNS